MSDYDPTIPFGSQNISQGQVTIQNNFAQLNTIFDFDHFTWNNNTDAGADRGLHRKITFPVPLGADPVVGGDDAVLYTKTVTALTELFIKNAGGLTQITSGNLPIWKGGVIGTTGICVFTDPAQLANGGANFPNGLQLRWGSQINISGTTDIPISPAFTTICLLPIICGQRGDDSIRSLWVDSTFSPTASQFKVRTNSTGIDVLWIAIGK